jgi:hypothetical protein
VGFAASPGPGARGRAPHGRDSTVRAGVAATTAATTERTPPAAARRGYDERETFARGGSPPPDLLLRPRASFGGEEFSSGGLTAASHQRRARPPFGEARRIVDTKIFPLLRLLRMSVRLPTLTDDPDRGGAARRGLSLHLRFALR